MFDLQMPSDLRCCPCKLNVVLSNITVLLGAKGNSIGTGVPRALGWAVRSPFVPSPAVVQEADVLSPWVGHGL